MPILERLTDTITAVGRAWRGDRLVEPAPDAETAAARSRGPVAVAGTEERYQVTLGAGLTPEAVARTLKSADQGYMARLCDLASEQRTKVTHLAAVLDTRETALAGCDYEIEARTFRTGTRDSKRAATIADYCADRVAEINTIRSADGPRSLSDLITHLSGGIYYGRSAVELVFKRDRFGVGVGDWSPIHPRRLSYAGDDWRIRIYDEQGNRRAPAFGKFPGVVPSDIDPHKFVIHEPRTFGAEYPTRQGLARVLVWAGMFWTWTNRDWYAFAELFGKPLRIGTFTKAASDADITTLKQALAQLGGMSTAVIAETCRAELVWPAGNGASVHEKLRTAQNAEISKVVLGQTSTTELGDVGTYASSKVHRQVQQDRLAADGRSMGDTLTRALLYPLVLFKFGREAADRFTPRFEILTAPDVDLTEEAKRATLLIDRGVPMSVDALRERYTSIPKPADDEVVAHPLKTQGVQDSTIADPENDTTADREADAPQADGKPATAPKAEGEADAAPPAEE